MPKVTIADGYEGHHHKGRLVLPGEVIEVSERQEKYLRDAGALAPKSRSRKAKPVEPDEPDESEAADATTEDQDESS